MTNPNGANQICVICSEGRYVERCHIFPKILFHPKGKNKDMYDFNGKNILIMCPTHHKLFDRFLLSDDEKDKIRPIIHKLLPELLRIGEDIESFSPISRIRFVSKFDKWFDKFKLHY